MGIPVEISGGSCIFLAIVCILLPPDWLMASLSAAFFHELCHIAAVLAVGGTLRNVQIGAMGALLEASPMKTWQRLICTLAGPLGSLSLLLIAGWCPKTAFCGLVQGFYNLLPLDSLDGGHILSCVTKLLFSQEKSRKICNWAENTTLFLSVLFGFWGTFCQKLGLMPLLLSVYLLSRVLPGKIPCKEGKLGVQ